MNQNDLLLLLISVLYKVGPVNFTLEEQEIMPDDLELMFEYDTHTDDLLLAAVRGGDDED